jgi:hypothetical protein
MLLAELMAVQSDFAVVAASGFGPDSVMVGVNTDGRAALVSLLPGNIDTVLCATVFQQLLLGVVVEEDIKITFNLLGGRPIYLTVLLQTLDVGHFITVGIPALVDAKIHIHRTN